MSKKIKNLGKIRFLVTITFLSSFFLIGGCERKAAWINMEPKSVTIRNLSHTTQINALVFDKSDSPIPDAILTWESSNPEVAVVGQDGIVRAKASGDATVSAMAKNGIKAVIQVRVSIPSLIKVSPKGLIKLKVGETIQFKAEVQDESGRLFEDQTVGWGSSDPNVVSINAFEGLAKAVGPGETTIKASLGTIGLRSETEVVVESGGQ